MLTKNRIAILFILFLFSILFAENQLESGAYEVQEDDTLYSIAKANNISVNQLMKINDLSDFLIYPHQKLYVGKSDQHTVEEGDSLWKIAEQYGATVENLIDINNLESGDIYPGQLLLINKAEKYTEYEVRKDDTLYQIAGFYEMSLEEIKKLNNLSNNYIFPGEIIKVFPLLSEHLNIGETANYPGVSNFYNIPSENSLEYAADNYYYSIPDAEKQLSSDYFENPDYPPIEAHRRGVELISILENGITNSQAISNGLSGWQIVIDPGHGGIDPGSPITSEDGAGNTLYVIEDEYVYDISLRLYILLRLNGADVKLTLLSPNHLLRNTNPATVTLINEKNEVF